MANRVRWVTNRLLSIKKIPQHEIAQGDSISSRTRCYQIVPLWELNGAFMPRVYDERQPVRAMPNQTATLQQEPVPD